MRTAERSGERTDENYSDICFCWQSKPGKRQFIKFVMAIDAIDIIKNIFVLRNARKLLKQMSIRID